MTKQHLLQQQQLKHNDHLRLLETINNLPYDHTQIRIYQKSIEELFNRYDAQANELAQTLSDYEEVAKAIKNLKILMGQRKYVTVKKLVSQPMQTTGA